MINYFVRQVLRRFVLSYHQDIRGSILILFLSDNNANLSNRLIVFFRMREKKT